MGSEDCNNHFTKLRGSIQEVIMGSHFKRDLPDFDPSVIIDAEHENHTRLHKYEETIDGITIFRAIIDHIHIVYVVDDKHRLIFLRAFKNFNNYDSFLSNKKKIKEMVDLI